MGDRLTEEQIQQLWSRRQQGQSIDEIGRALGRPYGTLYHVIAVHGGIAPPMRQRAVRHLSLAEREEISRGISAGATLRQIARQLKRAASTVSREIARHGGVKHYRAARADASAWGCARRPKPCLLAQNARLRALVSEKLQRNWSPEQISRWLEIQFVDDKSLRVSPETIYRSLFIQARGALKKELMGHLRRGRSIRRAKKAGARRKRQGQIIDAISIRQRPAEAEDRAVPGHWEGDLLCGSTHSQIATLVERHSRYVLLVKLPGKDTVRVVQALSAQIGKLPMQLRRSLTWDRGLELAAHKQFTIDTQVQVYFCDPHSPWQRGSNENTNGLLRQYFPKGADVSRYSQAQLDKVARELNERPRKTLGFRTPAAKLAETVALMP